MPTEYIFRIAEENLVSSELCGREVTKAPYAPCEGICRIGGLAPLILVLCIGWR
jgi:hypothetical protein